MKIQEIIDILEEEFPKESAYIEDFIGLQLKGKTEIKNIYLTLDITMKVIEEAITNNIDLIIAHHPLFYGERDDLFKKDSLLKAKVELLEKQEIAVYIIHTNADFNPFSIAYAQASVLDLENISQLNENQAVLAFLKKEKEFEEFLDFIKKTFDIKNKIRTNIYNDNLEIKNVIIASGAMGDLIYEQKYKNNIFIIGELKYHHWIYANDNNIKVIEIGHQTEDIFVNIVNNYLEKNIKDDLIIILNKDDHVYRTI